MTEAILTKKQLADCKAGMYECSQILQLIEKAQACGIECEERELRTQHLNQFYRGILDNFSQPLQPGQS